MAETGINFVMETLNALKSSSNYLPIEDEVKDLIATLYDKLGLLRTFFKEQERFYQNEKVKSLEIRIREVENVVKWRIAPCTSARTREWEGTVTCNGVIAADEVVSKRKELSLNLDLLKQEIEAIETELKNVILDLGGIQIVNFSAWPKEIVVGFKDEEIFIKEKLTRVPKELQLILIYGMAGQGKTTLAKKVYNDPLVVYHFDLHAWINVSQEYQKRDLLLGLLRCVSDRSNGINQMSEEELGEQLYKRLKGMKYFIVMDDVWDSGAWADLKDYFPNDRNGSRILFTSRLEAVAFAQPVTLSRPLPLLTHDESWELFRLKVFHGGTCPFELMEIGMQIAKKCGGLPLAIIMVAGILANEEKRKDRWEEVEKIMSQSMVADPNLCMKIFKLSYKHLPRHLRPCFLYFAAFPEDFQIPVRKLIWLWIAEGFIQKTREKNLEDVAEEYLMNLIYRSLIMVSTRGYEGRPKTCSIHDLLRGFCLKKAEKENFLRQISGVQQFSSSSSCPRRLCIDSLKLQTVRLPSVLDPHSFLCIGCGYAAGFPPLAFPFQRLKLLRVLDVSFIQLDSYPMEIEQLGFLRYLALSLLMAWLPASICNLCNLETLIIFGYTWTSLSLPIEKMEKLRHVLLNGPMTDQGMEFVTDSVIDQGVETLQEGTVHTPLRTFRESSLPLMDSLQTLLWVNPIHCESILNRAPNLRKLGIQGKIVFGNLLVFPRLTFLQHLQKLKLFNTSKVGTSVYLRSYNFPRNIKKLSLHGTNLGWDEISKFGMLLPNLEVLKLLAGACSGSLWVTGEVEFPKLKFLKFENLDIESWDGCSNHFPRLQRVALVRCAFLKQIPSEIGYIPTLLMIEIRHCNRNVANSARKIKQEQENMGNHSLQITVEPQFSRFSVDDELC
ncbi:putative late blight resistance protein homolog R1B-16 [Diospyros lotus]|uniref:putative late blight resistance protein homolog R1B-16 n=1 Tax=Diospyros lotus TaxID=55363 RepID=UPI002258636B|nr:putative late blight resistance protein homolog R1B-16 [Diospyros lotus]XP_052205102.1 putative late blight resistance protein homolog R1B-16 [Diospyros lotus]XP_052205103.1 putative late blight resistance protein homolog R1B-16 [Diospyros lotus]XP_052205104.1 putative late blight resistance protein homolog R1B-16 [Diospyros lotus]